MPGHPIQRSSRWLWATLLGAPLAAPLAAGCGSGTEPSPAGTVEVTVTTAGPGVDPDGFAILVDGQQRESLPAAGRAVIAGMAPGPHSVELGGVASTCTVSGDNPQTVDVPAGASTNVGFAVSCPGPTGVLRIITHTSGSQPDPDGYSIRLDGAGDQAIGIEDTVDVAGLVAAEHLVELRGAATNCAVAGLATRRVTVIAAATTTVVFETTCTEANPANATLIVSVASQLINAPSGLTYTVVLDGNLSLPVASSGTATFQTVAGLHSVLLRVPGFCAVGGFFPQPNPMAVTVTRGEVRVVRFSVLCIG